MGGFCSKRSVVDKSPSESTVNANNPDQSHSGQSQAVALPSGERKDKWLPHPPLSCSDQLTKFAQNGNGPMEAGEPRELHLERGFSQKSRSSKSKPPVSAMTGGTKVSEVSSLLGKASTVGFGKAVDVLDTLGSSMTSLNLGSGFISASATKGNIISILAFEVANTIVKGANLMHSLSEENVKRLKEVVLPSEGVQLLVSKDMDGLLTIAAAEKREELKVFSVEVIRFGNRCKDPQWHNLERYFEKLSSDLTPQPQLQNEAEANMQQLMTLVQHTAELYHELIALDKFDQDYRRRLQEEENLTVVQQGDSLQFLKQELKSQRKHVKRLKKKSLWSRILEEITEKLVDIVHFLHLEIHGAFGTADRDKPFIGSMNSHQRLGSAGLALHYANIITQIDTMASRSTAVPPHIRDGLYQGLPPSIKRALRSKLLSIQINEELTVAQIKADMDKTLLWLVPVASNTTKAHHGFGWVGEWANTGSELNQHQAWQTCLSRIETLHYANKEKTEAYMINLILSLHQHICLLKSANGGQRSPTNSPICSPTNHLTISLPGIIPSTQTILSQEDQEMLQVVNFRKLIPGISKSQEFDNASWRLDNHCRLIKSNSHSLTTASKKDFFPSRRPSMVSVIDFDIDRIKALDVIDRVDTLQKL